MEGRKRSCCVVFFPPPPPSSSLPRFFAFSGSFSRFVLLMINARGRETVFILRRVCLNGPRREMGFNEGRVGKKGQKGSDTFLLVFLLSLFLSEKVEVE